MALTTSWVAYATSSNYSAVTIGFKYSYLTGTNKVRVYLGYQVNSSYSGGYGSDYSTGKINGTTVSSGSYRWYGTSWNQLGYTDITCSSGNSEGNTAVNISWSYYSYHFQSTPSGTLTIPAKVVPASQYCSACGAPTACTVSPTIQTPNGTVTVSWSGATAGTLNSITGYEVVLNGVTNSVSTTAASGSTSFSSLGLTRGTSYTAKVRTLGSAGSSYYSGYKTSTNSVKGNTLPGKPSISGSDKTIGANTAAPSYTITNGSTESGQTTTLKYGFVNSRTSSENQTSTASSVSVTIDPAVGSTKTLYAWTYDGLEYYSSTAVTRSVTRKNATSLAYYAVLERERDCVYIDDSDVGKVVKIFAVDQIVTSDSYSQIKLLYKTASSTETLSDEDYVTLNSDYSLGTQVDTANLGLTDGYVFKFAIQLYDPDTSEWSDNFEFDEIYRVKSNAIPELSVEVVE